MQRVCFRLQLNRERLDEYVERHSTVWPEMRAALSSAGWRNYTLFVDRQDGTLIGYFETDNLAASLDAMQATEVNARWQAEMAGFFAELDDRAPDEAILQLPEIFHLI
jgi:L-rhamnose mutarotase